MSKEANHFLIGVFTLIAIVGFAAGLVVLGSGKMFKEEFKLVAFFDGSVKGLKIGAGVTFRGVKIGEVSEIQVQLDHRKASSLVPVVFVIYPDKIIEVGERPQEGHTLVKLIDNGLRAQLEMESIVTGILGVNLDYFPDREARYIGAFPKYMEIPTVPSDLEELSSVIKELPIKDIAEGIKTVTIRVGELLETKDAESIAAGIDGALADFRKLMTTAESLAGKLDRKVDPLYNELSVSLQKANTALMEIQGAASSARSMLSDGSESRHELKGLIVTLREAAEKVRDLADYLERNPEALVRGKH